jgi:hypothetical protein
LIRRGLAQVSAVFLDIIVSSSFEQPPHPVSESAVRSLFWLRTFVIALVVTGLSGTGCGVNYNARAKVIGKVKFFDKYLTAGTVAFVAADGRVGSGNIDFDGNYVVHDAPIGEVSITVKVPTVGSGSGKEKREAKPPAGLPPMQAPGGGDNTSFVPSTIDSKKIVQIPGKYGSTDTSGLKYTVVKGEQTYDITLSP